MPSYRDAQPPGFEITRDLQTWETKHTCPRCGVDLYAGEKDDIRVEACGRCGGIWFSNEQAKRALAMGSRAAEELAKKVEAATRPRPIDESKLLRCPECNDRMARMNVLGLKKASPTVDACHHGTWFDRDELRPAMRMMRGETPEEPATGVEARYLESLRSPFSGELDEMKRTLSAVLHLIVGK